MLWLSFHFERSLKTLQILLKHSSKVHKVNFLTSFIFLLNIDDTIHLLHECWRHIKIHSFRKKNLLRASPEKNLSEIKHFIFLRSIQNTPSSHRFSNWKSKNIASIWPSMLIFPSISHTSVQVVELCIIVEVVFWHKKSKLLK